MVANQAAVAEAELLLRDWGDVLGCPACGTALMPQGTALQCPGCGQTFSVQDQVPALLCLGEAARFAAFSARYRQEREGEGWRGLSSEQALALPYGRPSGYPSLYWLVRRRSYGVLIRVLRRLAPPQAGPVADLGAGSGWLAYRLAQAGYRALAVDASLDEAFGLGAGAAYAHAFPHRLLRVQGDLEHPPFQAGVLGLILFNASLHYAVDLQGTLCRAAQALRPHGGLVILDTPIARQPCPGSGRGDRHLGREELQQALRNAGLQPHWVTICRGPPWWSYQARKLLRGKVLFTFPLVVAEKHDDARSPTQRHGITDGFV